MTSVRRRKVIVISTLAVGFAVIIAAWNQPALLRVGTLISLFKEKAPTKLPVPVEEVASTELADTWGAPRSGNRRHEGIDIFAPLGRPVLSTTSGVVFKVGENDLGGHVVRVLGPGWQWHYYAHLDRFADIEPGSLVQQGSVLGYVGSTGNARGTPHHLHYGVYRFWGSAQNPYPLLAADLLVSKTKNATPRRIKAMHTTRLSHSRRQVPPRKLKSPGLRASTRQATR